MSIQPKSFEFKNIVDRWLRLGIVSEWNANCFRATSLVDSKYSLLEEKSGTKYVAIPTMSSISRHFLSHPNISSSFNCHAIVTDFSNSRDKWILTDNELGNTLGEFDWVISSDRYIYI